MEVVTKRNITRLHKTEINVIVAENKTANVNVNHNRFQTKMGKVYTRFQTKKAQNPYPTGRHIPIWLI